MKKFLVAFCALFSLLAVSGFAADEKLALEFTGESGSRMLVFKDISAPNPKCMCSRFTVIVDDRTGPVGKPFVQTVELRVKDGETLTRKERLSVSAIWRMPDSPVITDQILNMGFDRATRFELRALRKFCMNPTRRACSRLVPEVIGEFTAGELGKLPAANVYDVLKQ